ncbi:MAG: hypothetical protein R3E12_12160 [Candidatus Eisenbacteria bacterium]
MRRTEPEDFLQDDEGARGAGDDLRRDATSRSFVQGQPVVETIVQTIISRALALGASDAISKADQRAALRLASTRHAPPLSTGAARRQLPQQLHTDRSWRLKVMCEMDITSAGRRTRPFRMLIRRRDGKLSNVDFRVSTVPSRWEGMVIRPRSQKGL